MKVARSDFFLGVGAIVLSAAYLYVASGIQDSLLSDSVGAAGVPRALGWVMGALGVLLCLRSVSFAPGAAAKAAPAPVTATGEPAAVRTGMNPHLQALCLLGILVGYILLAPYLGYMVTIALLVAAIAWFGGAPVNRNMLLISAAAGIGLWVIFAYLLGIAMTTGSLFGGA